MFARYRQIFCIVLQQMKRLCPPGVGLCLQYSNIQPLLATAATIVTAWLPRKRQREYADVNRRSTLVGLSLFFCISMPMFGLLTAFVPDRKSAPLTPSGAHFIEASVSDAKNGAALPSTSGTAENSWTYRKEISREQRAVVRYVAPSPQQGILGFTDRGIALRTAAGERALLAETTGSFELMHSAQADALPLAHFPAQYGEALDLHGQPLRWSVARKMQKPKLACVFVPAPTNLATTLPKNTGNSLFARAGRYRELVERFSDRFRISTELVYAIIHNESNFQPGTVSHRQAMGLMQLLPSTAGGEVHRFLHGYSSEIDPEELMAPENNLRYGVAYLHLLLNRHFAGVNDPQAREYCAIAAYNLGPNALLNSFSRDREEAINIINSLSPDALYSRLSQDLPVPETRNFIARVLLSKKEFAEFQ